MRKDTLDIKTVCQCNCCLGSKTLHPQVSIINLESPCLEEEAIKFEFYAILLIEECPDECCSCGRKYYDYSNATMVFLTPGEIFRMSEAGVLPPKGWLLAFHPDLLYQTSLKSNIKNYTFFNYHKEEALHLSQRETSIVTCCMENIEEELHHDIDKHTNTILSRHIELLLDYCSRFYERQFITRTNKNKDLISNFKKILTDYIKSGELQERPFPKPDYFADMLNLSPAYLSDLIEFETGQTMESMMQLRRMEIAKETLRTTRQTTAYIAHRLGYPNVQYFSKLFKKLTGMTVAEYRQPVN